MTDTELPADRRYTKSHEWVKVEGNEVTVGITDHAQSELTDIVFVDLPTVGKAVGAGASALVLESVKTVADVYAPVAGTISAVNQELKGHPELINQDPYGKGWIFKVTATGPVSAEAFLDGPAYRATWAAAGP
ncbi:MAG: glycine cleavage system protein GcvH [Thermoplasmata archaeon]|nr:glycine cleavage system protein GcvH [Thermoplasmata archaeon]